MYLEGSEVIAASGSVYKPFVLCFQPVVDLFVQLSTCVEVEAVHSTYSSQELDTCSKVACVLCPVKDKECVDVRAQKLWSLPATFVTSVTATISFPTRV